MRDLVISRIKGLLISGTYFDSGRFNVVLSTMYCSVNHVVISDKNFTGTMKKVAANPTAFIENFEWSKLSDFDLLSVLELTVRRFAVQR